MRKNRIARQGLKMCGTTGGAIVPCGPMECYRVGDECRPELAGMIRNNRQALDALLDGLLRDYGPMTSDEIQKKASERYGIFVASLLMLVAKQR